MLVFTEGHNIYKRAMNVLAVGLRRGRSSRGAYRAISILSSGKNLLWQSPELEGIKWFWV